MGIFEEATASLILADYIAVDAAGKINALGVGFMMASLTPEGMTAPQYVAAIIDVPPKYAGDQYAVSIELRDETTGKVAQYVDPGRGQAEALRVQQLVLAQRPTVPGMYLPEAVPCRSQLLLAFQNGLPLQPGHHYKWRLEIEGQHRPAWHIGFFCPAPPPAPVIGGPSSQGPTDMPNLSS